MNLCNLLDLIVVETKSGRKTKRWWWAANNEQVTVTTYDNN